MPRHQHCSHQPDDQVTAVYLPYRGLYLYARTLGPFYRIVIRDKDENGRVMAVSSGFTVPAMGLMHCDSLEIFTRGSAPPPERLTLSSTLSLRN